MKQGNIEAGVWAGEGERGRGRERERGGSPDRLADLTSHYEFPRVRKVTDFQNYMIRDYLKGLMVTRYSGSEVVADGSAVLAP